MRLDPKKFMYFIERFVDNDLYLVKHNHFTVIRLHHSKQYVTIDYMDSTTKTPYEHIKMEHWTVYKNVNLLNEFVNFNSTKLIERLPNKNQLYPI